MSVDKENLPQQPLYYHDPAEDEIDLKQLIRPLWRGRRLLAISAVAGAILMTGFVAATSQRVTEAYFKTPGISIQAYKQYLTVFINEKRFDEYIKANSIPVTDSVTAIRKALAETNGFDQLVQPTFSFTKDDAKRFNIDAGEKGSQLVGLRLSIRGGEPATNEELIVMLSGFLRAGIVHTDLKALTQESCRSNTSRLDEIDKQLIDSEFTDKQEQKRLAVLQGVIERNPAAATLESRQVISIEKGAERFLAPVAQLVGSEITIAELKLESERLQRQKDQATLFKDFYCDAFELLEQSPGNRDLIDRIDQLRVSLLVAYGEPLPEAVAAANAELRILLHQWRSRYLKEMDFLTSPSTPERPVRKMALRVAALLGLFGGTFAGIFSILLGNWWRSNRDEIVSAE
jgi:hypothetical protein